MAAGDTTYTYSGPLTGIKIGKDREVILTGGNDYDLPADDPKVKRLVALERLTPVQSTASSQSTASTKSTAKEVIANAG